MPDSAQQLVASAVFLAAYLVIITDKIHRTIVALFAGFLIVALGIYFLVLLRRIPQISSGTAQPQYSLRAKGPRQVLPRIGSFQSGKCYVLSAENCAACRSNSGMRYQFLIPMKASTWRR